MILTCPACSTRYQADEAKFPSAGRTVRCAKCGHSWHQPGPELDAGLVLESAPPAPVSGPISDPEPDSLATSLSGSLADPVPAPSATRAFAPAASVAEAAPRAPRLQTLGIALGWLGLIAAVLLIGYAALRYRQDVAAIWPQSAGLYAGIGLPVTGNGLDFRNVSYTRQSEDGQPALEVTGRIVNGGARELPVPQTVRVTLSDDGGRELYHWSFTPAARTLEAGATLAFRTRLSSPPAAARHLEVRFAKDGS